MADWMTVLTLAAVTLVCGCTERPAPAPPPRVATNVLIITVDTLRADRVGIYGATNIETPNMDRLAHEGAWAPQSDAPVPLTRPSHVSLFTGRYPSEHGIRDNLSAPLNADVPLLSGIFQQAGFATAAFVASSVLDRQSGLARGFDVYSDRFGGADQRTGDVVTAEAIGWLRSPPKPKFFAWVHLYDPHAPYTPPEPYASRYAGRLYDGEVAWCDELVGRIVTALREAGTLDNTLVILTSDHGEALGEHGEDVHGYFVYEATLRVPLIVRGPGVAPGTRLGTLTRTIDLFPTVLDLMGVRADQPSSGRSLGPALRGGKVPDEPAFAESLVPLLHYGWSDPERTRESVAERAVVTKGSGRVGHLARGAGASWCARVRQPWRIDRQEIRWSRSEGQAGRIQSVEWFDAAGTRGDAWRAERRSRATPSRGRSARPR